MGIKTAQRSVPRPMIARFGGTHQVDLAVDGDEAARGMQEDYSCEDEHGDKITNYSVPRGQNKSPMASFAYGAGRVTVTESPNTGDEAYLCDDIQPEPSEADGEGQNMGGGQSEIARDTTSYRRRSGGIG
jgi:hypothetical protein